MLQTNAQLNLEDRVRWYTKMRWFYLLPLAAAGIVPQLISTGYSEFLRDQLSIAAVGVLANIGFYIVGRRRGGTRPYYTVLAGSQIFFDIILATWLILLNGGIESRAVIVYAIPIIMSGALLGRLATYITGITSAFSYIFVVTLDHLGKIQPPNIYSPIAHVDTVYYLRSVFFYGGILLVIAMIVDYVARQIRQEEQIEEEMHVVSTEKAKAEAIMASMGDALVAIDLNGVITVVNHGFERMIGLQNEDVVGQPIDKVLTISNERGESVPEGHRPLLNALKSTNRTPQRVTDYYYKRKNGSLFPFIAYVSPIVLQDKVIGATTVFQDSSNLQQMQQLRNNFVALASHQLKTPIAEIQGYLENMAAGVVGKLTKEQMQYIHYMYSVAERCAQLLTDLLDITMLEKGSAAINSKPTSLSKVLKRVNTIYRGRLGSKHLTLELAEKDGDLTVVADHNKLVESIGNVVANAIRFSRTGTIEISSRQEGDWAVIDVRDHGTGIDRDAIVALFEKDEVLSAAPTPEGGTGLGLYLAKQLVILQGGSIALTETSNKGTTITIRMPLKGA